MEFRLLGPLEVRVADEPVRLGGPKQRAVLTLLLLSANRVVARERLIDRLWGDAPPDTAVKAVQVYVSQVRRLLPPATVVTRKPGYMIRVEEGALDVQRFETLVAAAREAEPADAARLLREALDLWRGPPLADVASEPFARVEAARLDDLRLVALEARIEAELALGRHSELIGELESLVAEHPHRERFRRQLMLALYRSNRQAEALDAYRAARAALDELGLEPDAALRQLEKQILTHDPALELARDGPAAARSSERLPLPGPLVPQSPFPFVGRARELELLRERLDRVRGGEGSFVLLGGIAGGGKTRLIREFAVETVRAGGVVLYGVSDPSVSTPYQPLREWLEFLVRHTDEQTLRARLAPGSEALARLLPELTAVTGAPPQPSGDPQGDRFLLQSAAVELLRRVAAHGPLVLVADDVHWADVDTLQLLRRLSRAAPEAGLLVVAALRDRGEELPLPVVETIADLARRESVARLSLANLDDDDLNAFVRGSALAEPDTDLLAAFRDLTDGTPLLVCELWRDLAERGGIDVSDAAARLVLPVADLTGPEPVRDILRQRLSRLSTETTSVLELAAVAGPTFELQVLAAAAALEARALVPAVEQATQNGLLEELPATTPSCRFSHELVRRALYDRITALRRPELHLRIAEALERVHPARPPRVLLELAHHFTVAAPLAGAERAVYYNLRAADAAIAAVAFGEAAARLSAALAVGIDDRQERTRVQIELAYLLRELYRTRDAREMLSAALETAEGREAEALSAQLLLHRDAATADPYADPARMQATMQQALDAFRALGDPHGAAIASRRLGLALRLGGRVAESCAVLERALPEAGAHRVARGQIIGTLMQGLCWGPARVPEAIERCEQLLASSESDRGLDAVVNRCLSDLLAMSGRAVEALELVARSSAVLDELDHPIHSRLYLTVSAEARELAGDRAGAEADLVALWDWLHYSSRLQHHGRPLDSRRMEAGYRLALLCADAGRWADAASYAAYGAEVQVTRFLHPPVLGLAARARVLAARGDVDDARSLAASAVAFADQSDLLNLRGRVRLALAEVERTAGRFAEADAAIAEASELYAAKGNVAALGAYLLTPV